MNFTSNSTGAPAIGGFIARMMRAGVLDERARKRYTHRQSVAGESIEYAEKRADVPLACAGRLSTTAGARGLRPRT